MKTHKVVGIACAAVLATAIGCDNQEGMGDELLPDTDKANIEVDTIEVKAYTELESPIVSSNTSYMMLGSFKDEIFGVTEASFACKFSNASYGICYEGDVCDSIRLSLGVDYSSKFVYGDITKPVTIEVYRVTSPLTEDVYYSDCNMEGKYGEKVGDTTFVPCDLDTALSFRLDNEFGQKVVENTFATTFDDNICGLYFKVSSSNKGNSIVRFYRASDYTQYVVYRHNEFDTTSIIYSIQSTDCSFSMIEHQYDNTDVLSAVEASKAGEQSTYLYLQAMAGTKIRLDITGLDKIQRGKYFAVRNAYLEAPLADSLISLQKTYPAINNLVCVGVDKVIEEPIDTDNIQWYYDRTTDSYRRTNDSSLYFNDFVLYTGSVPTMNVLSMDTENNCYRINMTGRVVDLLNCKDRGDDPSYNIYLYPNARITDFNRSMICSPMKLVVEYVNYKM
ncbi:MAG: DUF4270 domain-containing protein [Bacteroidales bacterium]|nr:DUF4270 domain-containing protein [Bacteroidales bacterium]